MSLMEWEHEGYQSGRTPDLSNTSSMDRLVNLGDDQVDKCHSTKRKRCVCVTLVIAVAFIIITIIIITIIALTRPSDQCYAKAAVAADAKICSEIGRDILKRNGSAVDAAIASLLCLGVVNPQSIGIGGGVVFNIYNPTTGKVETINARETAPAGASENMFGPNPEKANPGLLIAVPGQLRGFEMAHNISGRLPWKELFEPSIKLAKEGFKIGKALAEAIKNNKDTIMKNVPLCEIFCDSYETILKENDYIRFPKLALTYKKIANEGANAFYDGSLSQNVVNAIKAAGGNITLEDLMDYKAEHKYALNFTVKNYTVYAPDAPFGGPVLALILNVLKGYNISRESMATTESKILTYHRMIETFHFADVQKSELGDPRYVNISEFITKITSDKFADYIRSKIRNDVKHTNYSVGDNVTIVREHGTSHLSIIAEDGSAVAVTSSINNEFGSKVISCSTGIIFNDQMNDFLDPLLVVESKTNNNRIEPGKRPLSSMCPTIIMDKDSKWVRMVVGSEGGTNITTAVAQVILNHLFFGYDDLQTAVDKPRVQVVCNETSAEEGFDKDVIHGLEQKNHHILNKTEPTVVQAVVRLGDKICAASDPRKGGKPAGY